MAVPAGGNPALILSGDVASLRGAIPTDIISGEFVKSFRVPTSGPDMGKLVIVAQNASGVETTLVIEISGGMVVTPTTAAIIWHDSATPDGTDFGTPVAASTAEVPTYPNNPPDPLYLVAWRSGGTPDDFTMTVGGTALIQPLGGGLGSTYTHLTVDGVDGIMSYYQTAPGFFAQLFAGERAVFT